METEKVLVKPFRIGNYVILARGGRGGMARVFLARKFSHNLNPNGQAGPEKLYCLKVSRKVEKT